MTIVMTGGGSGGHITPILAVARELKILNPDIRIVFIGQRGDGLSDLPAADPNIDKVYAIWAGKFRRYHGEGWRQIFDLKTQAKNMRDAFRVLLGALESCLILRRIKPSVIFTRGGFVSVPVAIGGWLNGIPYITHDSDSIPSLANRIIAKGARWHAVALPEDVYPYPRFKTRMVGVPVSASYKPVSASLRSQYRQELGITDEQPFIFVTGGGNGADQLNRAVAETIPHLLKDFPNLVVVHVAGRSLENSTSNLYDRLIDDDKRPQVRVEGFLTDLYRYSGAADIVVNRGGATNIAEFALQGKACVIIPSKSLVWNVKNVAILAERHAAVQLSEAESEEPGKLYGVLLDLLKRPDNRIELEKTLHKLARPGSAQELADLILELGKE